MDVVICFDKFSSVIPLQPVWGRGSLSVGHLEVVRLQQTSSHSDSEADIRQDHWQGQWVWSGL